MPGLQGTPTTSEDESDDPQPEMPTPTQQDLGWADGGAEDEAQAIEMARREMEMVRLLELASNTLDREACEKLVHGEASGPFFSDPPMNLYGTTALTFAVSFSLHRVVAAMLLLSLNRETMKGLTLLLLLVSEDLLLLRTDRCAGGDDGGSGVEPGDKGRPSTDTATTSRGGGLRSASSQLKWHPLLTGR